MHVLGYRVEEAVLVVAAVGAVAAVAVFAVLVGRGVGALRSAAVASLAWSVAVVSAVSLAPDVDRFDQGTCSLRLVLAPAPWSDDQRLLNVLMYVPLGFLAVVVAKRWTSRLVAVGVLLAALIAVEWLQRTSVIGRSCDLNDVIDNWLGVLVGAGVGAVVAAIAAARVN